MKIPLYTALTLLFILTIPHFSKSQVQKGNDIDGEASEDYSGNSVSMPDANTLAIGARSNDGNGGNSGHVRIYDWNGKKWVQKGNDINGKRPGNASGESISMPDSNTIAIGSPYNSRNGFISGHVRIFIWNGKEWVQKGTDIEGEAARDESGKSVCMPDANTVAIGAGNNDGNGLGSGHVRIYNWNGKEWVQKGKDIDGEAAGNQSGNSMSMPDSNTIAIGARYNGGNGKHSGHVRIYNWNGNSWVQKGKDINGEAAGDQSGSSVSMPDSNTVAIGAQYNGGNGKNSGHVRIYVWNGNSWVQKGSDIDGEASDDLSGCSVSMPDSNTIAIGALGNFGSGSASGHVRVYNWIGNKWIQKLSDIDGEAAGDHSGWSVSMPNRHTVAIGANSNDGNGDASGHVRVYKMCTATASTISVIECDSNYTAPSGRFTYTVSGTYNDTILNVAGCDSIITINLTLENVVTAVNATAKSLEATAQNATFQWLDCKDGYSKVPNATNQLFEPTIIGEYAVEVTQGNCTDTSACYLIDNVGFAERNTHTNIKLYPNPTNNSVQIELQKDLGLLKVTITNMHGQIIRKEQFNGSSQNTIELPETSGWYIITVQPQDGLPARFNVLKL